jgi:hypothetical protein
MASAMVGVDGAWQRAGEAEVKQLWTVGGDGLDHTPHKLVWNGALFSFVKPLSLQPDATVNAHGRARRARRGTCAGARRPCPTVCRGGGNAGCSCRGCEGASVRAFHVLLRTPASPTLVPSGAS